MYLVGNCQNTINVCTCHYGNFAIVWSCDPDRLHGTMMGTRENGAELVWILSRRKYICRCQLNRMMDKVKDFHYDISKLKVNWCLIKECD